MDSAAFMGAGHIAKALLLDLMRQVNGANNGRLHLSYEWLTRKRGWKSRDTIKRAQNELVERGLVIQTCKGGLNKGASLFAVTWLPISNFNGLDFAAKDYQPGAWAMMDKHTPKNNSSVPVAGTAPSRQSVQSPPLTVPMAGTEKALFGTFTVPIVGNNVSMPYTPGEMPAGECPIKLPQGTLNRFATDVASCLNCNLCQTQSLAPIFLEAA
jgi:hypothetical protein